MALVEIEAGPFRVTAAVTRDAVEELGLAPGVPRDRGGQGDVGDGRARMRRALVARCAARCRRLRRRRDRVAAAASKPRADRLRRRPRCRRRSPPARPEFPEADGPAPVRRLRRARRADPPGRAGRRLRGGQHEAAGAAGREGKLERAGRVRVEPARARGPRRRRRSTGSRRSSEPGVKLVIGAEGVPVGDYTRDVLARLGAGAERGDPRERALERARRQGRRRQAHAGRRRRRASSTSPTSRRPAASCARSSSTRELEPNGDLRRRRGRGREAARGGRGVRRRPARRRLPRRAAGRPASASRERLVRRPARRSRSRWR